MTSAGQAINMRMDSDEGSPTEVKVEMGMK